jgi:hypothetical protein
MSRQNRTRQLILEAIVGPTCPIGDRRMIEKDLFPRAQKRRPGRATTRAVPHPKKE